MALRTHQTVDFGGENRQVRQYKAMCNMYLENHWNYPKTSNLNDKFNVIT